MTLTDMKEGIRGIGRAELVVGVARQAVGSSSATLQVCIGQRGGRRRNGSMGCSSMPAVEKQEAWENSDR